MLIVGGVSVLVLVGLSLVLGSSLVLVGSPFVFVFFLFTFDDAVDDSLWVVVVVGRYCFEVV